MQLSPNAKAGVTVLLSVILLASITYAVGNFDFGSRDAFEFEVKYSRVDGLVEGAPVRYAGVNVGTVKTVHLVPPDVVVTVKIDKDIIIPSDSQFLINNSGVLGDKYIEIKPGQAQSPLEINAKVSGVDPMALDSLLNEVENALLNLNSAVASFSEFAASDEIQTSVTETGRLLKETAANLKITVDRVNDIAITVDTVADDLATVSAQLPDLNIVGMFKDLESFSTELASLNLQEPVNGINQFVAQVNAMPLAEFTANMEKVSRDLASLNLLAIESDIAQFTSMLATINVQPLVDEVSEVTRQIKALDIEQRGEELAQFTAQLAEFPLGEIATDLQALSNNLAQVPVNDISANLLALSDELAGVSVGQIVTDLELVTSQLKDFGWSEMSGELHIFTNRLAELDIDQILQDVVTDFENFSSKLAQAEIDVLFNEIVLMVENLEAITGAVEPDSVTKIISDLEGTTYSARIASNEIANLVTELRTDINTFSSDSLVALQQISQIVTSVETTVVNIDSFVEDVVQDGTAAEDIRLTLTNIQKATEELNSVLETLTHEIVSDTGAYTSLKDTMSSINKINTDIENLRGMGDKFSISSHWASFYKFDGEKRPMADINLEFRTEDQPHFLRVGIEDILGADGNRLQLQYGRETGIFRQRYGIIDNSLGLGLDSQLTDKIGLSVELKELTSGSPTLSLRGNYSWTPDWVVGIRLEDVRNIEGMSIGVERRF